MIHLRDRDGKISEQGGAYSISSSPIGEDIGITVKKVGLFSERLHDLKIGDIVGVSGPAGWFSPQGDMEHVVCLAGGIGISPFRSILKSASVLFPRTQFTLFYSDRYNHDLIFVKELECLASNNGLISIQIIVTREVPAHPGHTAERIGIETMREKITSFSNKHFFACGSLQFVKAMKELLRGERVDNKCIHSEIF
jgi:ferredoxin-NADP reductase